MAHLVRIGNSQGVRIPKPFIEQAHLEGKELKFEVLNGGLFIAPNEMSALSITLVAPMTSKGFDFPCRVECEFKGKKGLILLDQIRAVDKTRLIKVKKKLILTFS